MLRYINRKKIYKALAWKLKLKVEYENGPNFQLRIIKA